MHKPAKLCLGQAKLLAPLPDSVADGHSFITSKSNYILKVMNRGNK